MKAIVSQEEYIIEQSNAIAHKCLLHTPIIYRMLGERLDRPEPIASSLLVKYVNNFFLLTASHIRKWGDLNMLGFFHKGIFIKLSGEEFFTQMNDENDDKIDLWIIKLDDAIAASLPNCYSFYDLYGMNIDLDDVDMCSYLLVGFPISRFKLNPDKKIISHKPFAFRTQICKVNKVYAKTKTYEETTVIFDYRKRKIKNTETGFTESGPNLQGASGCGIWLITNSIKGSGSSYLPVGLAIEHDANNCVIIATRLNVITEIIRLKWRISLPVSKKVRVNFLSGDALQIIPM